MIDKIVKKWNHWTVSEKIIMSFSTALFSVLTIIISYPFFWLFINSFKTMPSYYDNMYNLPTEWKFNNYLTAFSAKVGDTTVAGMFWNTIWYSFGATILNFVGIVCTAYALSRFKHVKGHALIYGICIFMMVTPIRTGETSMYRLLFNLDIADNPSVFWVTFLSGFGVKAILVMGFFNTVSIVYSEAAQMDGASNLRIFLQIYLPQIAPALVALMINHLIGLWNDYDTPWLYLPSFPTLSVGMWFLKAKANYIGGEPVYFAAVLLSIIPVGVLFGVFSKTIMNNSAVGGIKG